MVEPAQRIRERRDTGRVLRPVGDDPRRARAPIIKIEPLRAQRRRLRRGKAQEQLVRLDRMQQPPRRRQCQRLRGGIGGAGGGDGGGNVGGGGDIGGDGCGAAGGGGEGGRSRGSSSSDGIVMASRTHTRPHLPRAELLVCPPTDP